MAVPSRDGLEYNFKIFWKVYKEYLLSWYDEESGTFKVLSKATIGTDVKKKYFKNHLIIIVFFGGKQEVSYKAMYADKHIQAYLTF